MTVRMSMFVLLGAVTVVIFIASTLSLAQTTPTVPVAVSGDADTGPETVSVVFQSGELSPSGDLRFLLLSFKITVKIGKQYTNGATAWFSSESLVLHTPKGDAKAPSAGVFYSDHCANSCTITYTIPSDLPGVYTITNDYVGCCGTKHGQVTFTVPTWGANSTALGLAYLTPRAPAQNTCTGTFAGEWKSQLSAAKLSISVKGDYAEGEYVFAKERRIFKGKLTGNSFAGDWVSDLKRGGTFLFTLVPGEHRMEVRFSAYGYPAIFVCGPGKTVPPRKPKSQPEEAQTAQPSKLEPEKVQTPEPAKPKPAEVQTPSPQTLQPARDQTPQIQTPTQGGISIHVPKFGKKNANDHDTDGFKRFDALTKAQQGKLLTKKGPRLPLEYDMSDLSLRAFVKGGWPIVLDYGLESGAFAELSISVNGVTPFITKIDPAKRAQLRITIPNDFGAKPQVAKLRITALTSNKEPADFHLFGIAMGERGVLALWKVNPPESYLQVAMNSSSSTPTTDSEPLSLSTSNAPQTSSSIQISVADPTTIRPRQRPPLTFSATCHSNFSNGRWELWHVDGLRRAVEVWQESTGSILPNQTKSGKWNGIKSGKQVSLGNHFVQLTAWHGRQSDRDWVVASTDSNLIVIR